MKKFLTRKEAAAYLTEQGLPTSPNTLQKWATTGGGAEYQRYGNRALYTPPKLDTWAEKKLGAPRASTSDAA
jgi:hypothetical protein